MNYWLVRAKWGVENKKAEFINNDEWINGYEDKYLEIVKRVETEDILLLAEDSTVTHYGKCIDNPKDGKYLTVDKWIVLKEPIYFPTKGSSIKAIIQVNENSLVEEVNEAIEYTNLINNIKIKSIIIENFTVFKDKHNLEFSDDLNIIIGENSAGKTHLVKLLYLIITGIGDAYNSYGCPADHYDSYEERAIPTYGEALSDVIEYKLSHIFKPDNLDSLINYNSKHGSVSINLEKFFIKFDLAHSHEYFRHVIVNEEMLSAYFAKESCIFIPAKEIISFYEEIILSENRENSFDDIYHNLAHSLINTPLKNIESYPIEYKLLGVIEEILEGKILLERRRFYLVSKEQKTEISLIAEGLRKIGMIAQLLANGSLTKNSILFWDEPETNLNPRLIRKMAEVLMELSRAGMQIFIATHSLFLVKEIEILRKKEDKVKYFGLGFDENKEIRVSQSEDFEYLDDIVILDEAFKQNDRFLAKEDS